MTIIAPTFRPVINKVRKREEPENKFNNEIIINKGTGREYKIFALINNYFYIYALDSGRIDDISRADLKLNYLMKVKSQRRK